MTLYKRIMTLEGYAYEPVGVESKSVEELKDKMPQAFNHVFSLEVAFKEGYNQAIKDLEGK